MLGKTLSTHQIVDVLDQTQIDKTYNMVAPFLSNLRNRSNKHGNSLIHDAIVWNRLSAALFLITLAAYKDVHALWIKDWFPSSRSSPLILASKTGQNKTALLLVQLSENPLELDQQDYIGNTALHYACLMRNNVLIEALLSAGASTNIRNDQGLSALECYEKEASFKDLDYHNGTSPRSAYLMKPICDWNDRYQGTQDPSFSNYRWFLGNIIINLGLEADLSFSELDQTDGNIFVHLDCCKYTTEHAIGISPIEILKSDLYKRRPVIDLRVYHGMVNAYLSFRAQAYSAELAKQLKAASLIPNKLDLKKSCIELYYV
ncbi:MAG: hypothetical protein K0S29_1256 [Gammaproteobacteria bacterium]|jgi:hypothetical protein|nr:hypothetical protein [Gammaproteobacteria bacterium]